MPEKLGLKNYGYEMEVVSAECRLSCILYL